MKSFAGWMLLASLLVAGCGESPGQVPAEKIPEVPPPAETNEVEKIVPTELQIVVGEYEAAFKQKLAEIESLQKKVNEIPIEEMVEEQAVVIKKSLQEITDSLGEMMDELSEHLEALTEPPAEGQ
jgi:HAMP domain-containing protein